jgi:LPPG:FO 2-phospho-L-lactate transferase
MRVTALAGGTGAAKLLRGLAATLAPGELTVVGNTGDDCEVWGLHVSPDLDSVIYALADLADRGRGWGRADETFRCRDEMARLGEPAWFNLGDRDLAVHLVRTQALRDGRPLSEITRSMAARLGVATHVLPMSDDRVRTFIRTPEAWLPFQEYFVRERAAPKVLDVRYDGAQAATPAPGVIDGIIDADLVVVCPSNPVTSIGPIVAIRGIRDALSATRAPVVAVSPIVRGAAVSGPAGELMRARGLPVSPSGIALAYAPWLKALLVDEHDRDAAVDVEALGVRAVPTEIVMRDPASEVALARAVLGALG